MAPYLIRIIDFGLSSVDIGGYYYGSIWLYEFGVKIANQPQLFDIFKFLMFTAYYCYISGRNITEATRKNMREIYNEIQDILNSFKIHINLDDYFRNNPISDKEKYQLREGMYDVNFTLKDAFYKFVQRMKDNSIDIDIKKGNNVKPLYRDIDYMNKHDPEYMYQYLMKIQRGELNERSIANAIDLSPHR
jgi:hypothetical protein